MSHKPYVNSSYLFLLELFETMLSSVFDDEALSVADDDLDLVLGMESLPDDSEAAVMICSLMQLSA